MQRVVFVTLHYLWSKRRVDLHFLADCFNQIGYEALFFTVSLSHLSRIRRDDRLSNPLRSEANQIKTIGGLSSFVWFRPWHPVNLRYSALNKLSTPLFKKYGDGPLGEAESFIQQADLFIFESTAGIMLFDRFKKLNPGARFVYRVADDMRVMGNHPVILEAEGNAVHRCDLVSLTSSKFSERFSDASDCRVQLHGIDKDVFDREVTTNPYTETSELNVVSVGATLFDREALAIAAELFPNWIFHVFSWDRDLPARDNIIHYGERPFEETVPYLIHADIGLALYKYRDGAEYLAESSLKMMQYTYCRLPILAPRFVMRPDRPHVFGYRAGDDESIRSALIAASQYDRQRIDSAGIDSWSELARKLAGTPP